MELREVDNTALVMISGYGDGGFRIRGVRHKGHILIWPKGHSAWPIDDLSTLPTSSFDSLLIGESALEFVIVGAGVSAQNSIALAPRLSHALKLPVEIMATGAAVRTYNVLALEGRRVGAALWAV